MVDGQAWWALLPMGALLLGGFVGVRILRWRDAPRIAQLEEQAQRLPELEQALAQQRQEAQALQLGAAAVARDLAQAQERASRVPALEAQLTQVQLEAQQQLTQLRQDSQREADQLRQEAQQQAEQLRQEAQQQLAQLRAEAQAHQTAAHEAARALAQLQERLSASERAAADGAAQLVKVQEAMNDRFKALAQEIFDEKARRFAEQNQTQLGSLLDPLKQRIADFQNKVEDVYVKEGKDRSALAEQVRQLMELNQTLSAEARNLTTALKGSAKTQGNWGENILQLALEASGLQKGLHYRTQDAQLDAEGNRHIPDVVVELPEGRQLVIDAKVSLVAYERCVNAETDEDRAAALKQHLDSMRLHIKGLSGKRYQDLPGIRSLDFVLMFVPIEPAFMLAVTSDEQLFMDAWRANVLLVSPSTLLFVVRTVAHLWRQEQQGRNAQEIAQRGAELYDKFAGFVADLKLVGARLEDARNAYANAEKKLSSGKGNVLRQAEMLKDLGVTPRRELPADLLERGSDDDPLQLEPPPSA
jgi:DNA recombination protein RmuC